MEQAQHNIFCEMAVQDVGSLPFPATLPPPAMVKATASSLSCMCKSSTFHCPHYVSCCTGICRMFASCLEFHTLWTATSCFLCWASGRHHSAFCSDKCDHFHTSDKLDPAEFVFWLVSILQHNVLKVHPYCSIPQVSLLSRLIFCFICALISLSICPSVSI